MRPSKEVPGACFSKVQGEKRMDKKKKKKLRKVENDAQLRQQDPVKIPTSSPLSKR